MSKGPKSNTPYWSVQVSIANGVAKMASPSLAKLHHEILEEMGTPPSQELIDYFLEQVDIDDEELLAYYRDTGKYNVTEVGAKMASDQSSVDRIDALLQQGNVTVLAFLKSYLQQYGREASEQETREFLQRIQKSGSQGQKPISTDKQQHFELAESVALGAKPTVLKLRSEFSKRFGFLPSEEIIKYFLNRIHNVPNNHNNAQESDAKINFAKTVANGLISTVLQFRNAYEKIYGEEPSNEIIDIFIKNLSKKHVE